MYKIISIGIGILFLGSIIVLLSTRFLFKTTAVLVASPVVISEQINLASVSPVPTWTLLLTGDVIPARVVNQKMVAKNDFMWPLVNIAPILRNADLTLINLESPLIANCPITNEGMTFCGEFTFGKSLAEAGVDVANLANNHSLNYGWEALGETEKHLQDVGIETTGFTYQPVILSEAKNLVQRNPNAGFALDPSVTPQDDINNPNNNETIEQCSNSIYCSTLTIKEIPPSKLLSNQASKSLAIGFLGYNTVGQEIDQERMKSEIETADKRVDVLVVSVHWGKEYTRLPETDSIAPYDPKELGKLFIDWGADVVVGNHPHWYQGIEWYTSSLLAEQSRSVSNDSLLAERSRSLTAKPIFYALGNTVFDQEWSSETKIGYLAKLTFTGTQLDQTIEIIPIGIRDYGQAYLLEGAEKEKIISDVQFLSPKN